MSHSNDNLASILPPSNLCNDEDATLLAPAAGPADVDDQECCLVQIYPADVVDGMLLLEENTVVAGRDSECDLYLHDGSVSRQHAEFISDGKGYRLRDLGSTNGSLVNGQPVDDVELRSGDTIKLGCFMFKFLAAGSVESQYHETVYTAMTRDALTGAMNKRYLLEAMQREIARCRRQENPLAAVMLDIDHFKSVNDTHGHLVGDEVLREFGQRLGAVCREYDLLARYGGEEFCLVLFGSDKAEAIESAERCRQAVCATPFETAVGPLKITASFGISVLDPTQEQSPTDLIHLADMRLYDAKEAGRNCVRA